MIPAVNCEKAEVTLSFNPEKDTIMFVKCPLCSLDTLVHWVDIGNPMEKCCHVKNIFYSEVNEITVSFSK